MVLDGPGVSALLEPHFGSPVGDGVPVDLRGLDDVLPEAAWSLGRGLRLLALRGTVVSVRAPAAEGPRRALMGSLLGELVRNGLIRWEEP